jgi:hypothetical protein
MKTIIALEKDIETETCPRILAFLKWAKKWILKHKRIELP